ncbi:MAG: nucleotidyltransferase family protein [Acidimicrobiales bacterium]
MRRGDRPPHGPPGPVAARPQRPDPPAGGGAGGRLNRTAAVVLAAGGGSRFAGDGHKLLAPFRGRPLVAWAVAAAAEAGLDEVVVVSGAVDLTGALPAGEVTLLDNPDWADGQATSLGVALDWCGRQGHGSAVVGLGDQPLVPASAWRAVARAPGGPVVAASYSGQRRNPVRLDQAVWGLLPVDGDEGARVLMRRRPELVHEVVCDGDPFDVDQVEDLSRLEPPGTV